jgi:gas vesicle protein
MSTLDLSQPVLGAGASAATGWGSVEAQGSVNFTGQLEVNRGFLFDFGVGAMAEVSGAIRNFLAADLQADATAEARILAQLQVPMDLFSQAGFAAQLKATAEAAVGVQLRLGLTLGDFIAAVEADPAMAGVPAKIFRAFVEEVSIGGGVYAKAAVSAMVYASVVVAGRLVPDQHNPPGFTISAEAGAGLKAGGGYRVFANLDIANPRRMVARIIDTVVDETLNEIGKLLPEDASHQHRELLLAAAPAAKIALRNAFELGELIATDQAPQDAAGAQRMALRCVQVVLEETQRFVVDRVTRLGLDLVNDLLGSGISQSQWDAARTDREQLAARLGSMPAEPFLAIQSNLDYWTQLIDDILALASRFGAGTVPASWREPAAMIWAASQLAYMASRQLTEAQASATVIGLAPAQVHRSFAGAPPTPAPNVIRAVINASLGRPATTQIEALDLADYLLTSAVVDPLIQRFPEIKTYLDIFRGPIGADAKAILAKLLTNAGSLNISGSTNPSDTLDAIADALAGFLADKLEDEIRPMVAPHLQGRESLRLYFDEVMVPSLRTSVDLVFVQAKSWASGEFTPKAFTEALSGILIMIVGRGLVATTDVLVAHAQGVLKDELLAIADVVENDRNDPRNFLPIMAPLTPIPRPELAQLGAETFEILADVLGPFPPEIRAKVRALLYDIIESQPIGSVDAASQFAEASFIPNRELAQELAIELAEYAGGNFVRFVAQVLSRAAAAIIDAIADLIEDIERQVEQWINDIEAAAQALYDAIEDLAREIAELIEELQARLDEALDLLEDTLRDLDRPSGRARLLDKLGKKAGDEAVAVLRSNPLYKVLSKEDKRTARSLARSFARAVIDNDFVDFIVAGIGEVGDELADFIEDVRDLDPSRDLVPQLETLILDRIEDAVRDMFGGDETFPIVLEFGDVRIELGSVALPLNSIISAVRWAVGGLAFFEDQVRDIADKLVAAFTAEATLLEREAERSELKDDKAKVDAQIEDSLPGDVSIRILTPVAASAHETDVQVEVNLAGVPLSWLGLGPGERSRVQVLLDGAAIPLNRFEVEELLPADTLSSVPRDIAGTAGLFVTDEAISVASPAKPSGVRLTRKPTNATNLIHGRKIEPGVQPDTWGAARNASTGTTAKKTHWVRESLIDETRRRETSVGAARNRAGAIRKGGESIGVLGRITLAGSDVRRRPPNSGLLIRTEFDLASLTEGVHTLAVAIADGRGQRLSESAAFFVLNPEPVRPSGAVSRPGAPGIRPANIKPIHLPSRTPVKAKKPKISTGAPVVVSRGKLQERVAAAIDANAKSVPPTAIVERKLSDLKRNRRFSVKAAADAPRPDKTKKAPTPQ